ncbi:MAG: tetratricopeptide repeat protein, partial [Bacteroidales bacterium]|nr:tetratricopeptide repeat protein [Bacteroidales bacterium]
MKKDLLLNLILIVVLFLAYSNHFNNPFHFDDAHTIENNLLIRDLSNTSLFFKDATSFSSNPTNQVYRPVVSLSFAISYYFAGDLKPLYFHINIFLFFVLQIVLMFFLFKKILSKYLIKKSHLSILSILIVAWYALHTANAETINYVSSISDLYSAFFVVLALCIYVYAPKFRKWQLYLIPIVIGMLAKEQTAAFAPILFFYVLIFEQNLEKSSIFNKSNLKIILKAFIKSVPAFIVCGLMSLFVIKMQPESFTPGGQSAFLYILIQPWVFLRYFIALFLPLNLSADTDWAVISNIFDERIIIGFLFLIGLLILAIRGLNREKLKIISFGIFWFLLALAPTALVPLAEVTNDHRMFFPFVGLVISVGWSVYLLFEYLLTKLKNKKALKISILLLVFVVLIGNAYGVYQRNKVWSSDESLWYDVTVKSPNNGRGLMNYGLSQMKKGNYEIAHEYFTKALQLSPYYSYL